ncbi:MAG TPA: protein translocase subunit SecF [Ktedonobacteraceae bacterium]|nr:protein translocase subunit SecF [Ktedonobacteraceae bacterium]
MFNLVKYRYWFLIISLVIIVPGMISLVFNRLDVGIDFKGGANMELRPQQTLSQDALTHALQPMKLNDLQVVTGSNTTLSAQKTIWVRLNTQVDKNVSDSITKTIQQKYGTQTTAVATDIAGSDGKTFTMIVLSGFPSVPTVSDVKATLSKLPNTTAPGSNPVTATPTPVVTATPSAKVTTTPTTSSSSATIPVSVEDVQQGTTTQTLNVTTTTPLTTSDFATVQANLLQKGGPYVQLVSNSEVGPSVAQQTTTYAILAVLAASLFILAYIWFSFRKIPKAYRYGACAIIAMLHDVLVVVGVFSILGWLLGIQIDALFITALLTVVGFSVHDTIVVFDRVRENLQRRTSESFEEVVNASLVQTMARSLNTSLTVLFTLLTLTLFTGAGSVHNFTLALLIGIFSGTYSSIFNASMLLVIWEKGELGFDHLGGRPEPVRRVERERELARSRG